MRYIFDTESRTFTQEAPGDTRTLPIESPASLEAAGRLWTTLAWTARYSYQFTWLGRPIIQLPEDTLRYQELIWQLRPDVIVETGVAHGGSLVLSASLCRLAGRGRVIGIDVRIRPENRATLETHELADRITLVEGDSASAQTVARVRQLVHPGESVLVLLDSNHCKAHVLDELEAYAPLVSPGSYLIAADGIMRDLAGLPGAGADWDWNNPVSAVLEFLRSHPEFQLDPPKPAFDESRAAPRPTYWVDAFLRRAR